MQTIKRLSFIALATMLILGSCTVEKRVYTTGYNVDWKKGKQNSKKEESVSKNKETKIEKRETVTVEQYENKKTSIENTQALNADIVASADKEQIILQKKEKINFLGNHIEIKSEEEIQIQSIQKSILKKEIKQNTDYREGPKINRMALAGFICSILGFILLLFFLWPFMLGSLAVIFSSIGINRIKRDRSKWKGMGFAIAGLVIGIITILLFWLLLMLVILFLLASGI